MKLRLSALFAAILLAACSTGPTNEETAQSSQSPTAETEASGAPPPSPAETKDGGKKPSGGKGTPTPGATGAPSGGGGGGYEEEEQTTTAAGAPVHPESGRYLYNQDGFEELCSGAACQKENLPPTQTVDATYGARSDDSVTVVTKAQISEKRTATTTTVFQRNKAIITNLTVDFAYGAIKFHESIDPKPPIDAALLPLQEGKSWSGSWTADTSGDYSFTVAAHEPVTVGGRTIDAYRLDTHIEFRGEFKGTTDAQIWVDVDTGFIVKQAGKLDVTSEFGTYRSTFLQVLRSGPGY